MTRFVIVGSQRSGTTLIRSALDTHPNILSLGEVFYINRAVRKKDGASMGKDLSKQFSSWREHSYQNYMDATRWRKACHWLCRNRLTRQYLDYMYAIDGYQAIGFKMMVNQNKKFPAVLNYIHDNKIKVVHMYRKNPFDILLSRLTLLARGYAHSASQAGEAVTVTVDVDNLIRDLNSIQNESMSWKREFENKTPYINVAYENFVNERKTVSKNLLEFLELDASKELKSELVKVNTSAVSELVANFDEVKKCLNSSEFSWCV